MSDRSFKKLVFFSFLVCLSLLSELTYAAILRSSNGAPVLTKDGGCVITNWQGADECENSIAASDDAPLFSAPSELERQHQRQHYGGLIYFEFNKSTLTRAARHHLDRLAHKQLRMKDRDNHEPMLTIVGYADRLGKVDYNYALALKRAQTVGSYLLSQGIKLSKIDVRSLGKTVPKAECSADLPRPEMINCLKEDRRVEIEFGRSIK